MGPWSIVTATVARGDNTATELAIYLNQYSCNEIEISMKTASLTVRNIPKVVLERIRARAISHRRSMQGEILAILEASAAETVTRRSVSDVLERIRSQGLSTEAESTSMLRADRDDH
jgi:antitoxin FitA